MAWVIFAAVVIAAVIIVYTIREKGELSVWMSLLRIFEFKLDAKEKRDPVPGGQSPTANGK